MKSIRKERLDVLLAKEVCGIERKGERIIMTENVFVKRTEGR